MGSKIAIIGSGISGISTAHELKKLGFNVDIFEKNSFIGGRIALSELNGSPITIGGENIGKNYINFRNFCSDMNINDFEEYGVNLCTVSRKKNITLNSKHKLRTLINILRIVSLNDLSQIRVMIKAIKQDRNNAFLSGDFFKKYQNKTVDSFFSEDYIDYILRSLLNINNAAEPNEIYLETFGTNLSMLLDSYEHLTNGKDNIFNKFAKQSNILVEKNVTSLWYENNLLKGVIVNKNKKIEYDAVVLATTASSASKILEKTNKKLSNKLKEIRYFPVAMIIVKYEEEVFNKKRNGYVFPSDSVLSNVGAYGLNKYEYVRYTFSGRKARILLDRKPSIEELIEIGEKEFFKHIKQKLPKRGTFTGRLTKQTAYALHHAEFLKNIQLDLIKSKGLYLAGDYIEGASIEGCYRSGILAAKEISNDLGCKESR